MTDETVDDESDNESITSDNEYDYSLEGWRKVTNSFNDFETVHYTLEDESYTSTRGRTEEFIASIITANNSLRSVTSIRLLADIHNPDDPTDTRYSQNIRFETEEFADINELKRIITEYIKSNTAPIWHRLETDETSDRTSNKIVKYHKDYFDFCIQKEIRGKYQVTTICGEEEIHPGLFTKLITDHDAAYLPSDCLIKCLNEALNKRYNPYGYQKRNMARSRICLK